MQKEPTTVEKLRGLRWSITLNSANSVFVQFTYFGSAFVLFLDRLGLSKADIGFILSLIPFANLVAIWIAPLAARYGYKRTFIIFFGLRKLVTFFLLLTPWVVAQFGAGGAPSIARLGAGLVSFRPSNARRSKKQNPRAPFHRCAGLLASNPC